MTLIAADGHQFEAHAARPEKSPTAGLVICQEVFGVTAHIREVTDEYASAGYLAVAPALYDRVRRGVELDYTKAGISAGRRLRSRISWEQVVLDVDAARAAVSTAGKVGVIGYCWGGSVAWLAACRLEMAAAVCYYGGYEHRDKQPRCPVMMHFAIDDEYIPVENVAEVRRLHPHAEVHLYTARHGFNCNARADFNPKSALLARKRTTEFLSRHLRHPRN